MEYAAEKPCEQGSFSDLDGKANGHQNHGQEDEIEVNCNPEEDLGSESDKSSKEKALKKPDKVLPCPRCNSSETKFCYFNNYNVNQPRHFCKNCHRYWTAGGTIRNVPVGAGRRRNHKHSSSQTRQVETNQNAASVAVVQGETSSGESLKDLGSAPPLCESMQTMLNLKEAKSNEVEEPSESSSSSAAATSRDNGCPGGEDNAHEHTTNPMQCYPVPQWTYPWNPGWNFMMVGATNANPSPSNIGSPAMVTVPGFCPPNIAFPFVPASYWGYVPGWENGKWIPPPFGSTGSMSPSCSPSNSGCSANSSPTLGKHSRDTNTLAEANAEPCLWVPKTLRIDDPDEAAKSSIWSTLGIEPDRNKGVVRGGIFKPFQHKPDVKSQETDADQALQSNPAALSRSHSFQEST